MTKKNYINNKNFYVDIVEYKKNGNKKAYERIGKKFILIVRNYLKNPNLIQYSSDRKDEMESSCLYYMVKAIDKYDVDEHKNPLSYFTTITKNEIYKYLNKQNILIKRYTSLDFNDSIEVDDIEGMDEE